MKHVLWVSSHWPTEEQRSSLESALRDEVNIDTYKQIVKDIHDVIDVYKIGKYDEIVVTIPHNMISKLIENGIKPIKPKMQKIRTPDSKSDYVFRGFARVLKMEYSEVWLNEH